MKIRSNQLDPMVAQTLRATGQRWQWLYFGRLASLIVIALCLVLAGVAGVVLAGWLWNTVAFILCVVFAVLLAALALIIAGMVTLSAGRPDSWVAARIEGAAPRLLDRVNTLIHLQGRSGNRWIGSFFRAIGRQAGSEISRAGKLRPISPGSTILLGAAALAVVVATFVFWDKAQPWDALGSRGGGTSLDQPEDVFDLALPEEGTSEMRQPWGEVRITEPGGDLKLTKVDVLPLTVEAASNQPLATALWTTGVNGGQAQDRLLPAPQEPNYAVYEPMLYLDELAVDDWDVVSYSAAATTNGSSKFASEIYFVEIRPFREEMMKLEGSGGKGGMACLQKLGRLIEKEREILRSTHRHEQRPASTKTEREQDQEKLGAAQEATKEATAHLYGEVAALDHMNVGTVLDQLAQARGTMETAVGELQAPDNVAAQQSERLALQQLVESRKDLVKSISGSSGEGSGQGGEDNQPVAGMKHELKDVLKDMAEFRDAGQAAAKAVQQAREAQEKLAGEAAATARNDLPGLAAKQDAIARALQDFRERVPAPFEAVSEAEKSAHSAMKETSEAMAGKQKNASAEAQRAAQALAGLELAMQRQDALRATADVYRMKAVMDDQAKELEKMRDAPGEAKSEEVAKTGERLGRAKEAMEETLRETPAGELFGPGLEKALSGEPGQQLGQAASQMQGGSPEAAGQALAGLEQIAKAFEASKPGVLQGEDGPGEGSSIGDAARMLSGLAERLRMKKELSPEDMKRQLEEARFAVMNAKETSTTPPLLALAAELEKMSGTVDLHVDEAELRKLVDRLENYRLELGDKERAKPVDPALLKADPAQAPAEYRERVRRYFQKLSEG